MSDQLKAKQKEMALLEKAARSCDSDNGAVLLRLKNEKTQNLNQQVHTQSHTRTYT